MSERTNLAASPKLLHTSPPMLKKTRKLQFSAKLSPKIAFQSHFATLFPERQSEISLFLQQSEKRMEEEPICCAIFGKIFLVTFPVSSQRILIELITRVKIVFAFFLVSLTTFQFFVIFTKLFKPPICFKLHSFCLIYNVNFNYCPKLDAF